MSPVTVSMRWCVSCVRMTHGFHEAALITDSQAYTIIAAGVDHASGCEVARSSPTLVPHLRSPYTTQGRFQVDSFCEAFAPITLQSMHMSPFTKNAARAYAQSRESCKALEWTRSR